MQAEGLWQIEKDVPFYSNRYHHCCNSDTYIMTGSLPVIRFGKRRAVFGSIRFFDSDGVPLNEKKGVTFRFRSGQSGWDTPDASILAGAPENAHAVIVRIACEKPVTVKFGGVHRCPGGDWNICPDFDGNYRTVAFDEAQLGETYTPVPGGYLVEREEVTEYLKRFGDTAWKLYLTADFPLRIEGDMAVGECVGEGTLGVFLLASADGEKPLPLKEAFASVNARADRLCARLTVTSPNAALNAACAFAANYQDGIWYPPKHMHAETTWNTPFIGWTNRYGSAVLGWHDRVLEELKHYSGSQIREKIYEGMPEPEPGQAFLLPPPNSAFYGKGRIDEDQGMYGMQSVYFDQAIHSWRMTGDPEMAKTLRPMLELHCCWLDDCFERDQSGTYEGVIDSWPTDSVWSDGGATPEQTAYACRAHEAARDLAILDGDTEAAVRHGAQVEKIRENFMKLLWSDRIGAPGKCREQLGYRRLLESPWSYSIFLPVDAGLLDDIRSAQALYYTKWAYQNDPTPNGRIVWHSNWVPMIWSVRPAGGLEQYMLAQAFFKAGLPEDGMALLNGMLDRPSWRYSDGSHISSSGSLQSDGSRAVLEGLFGYRPDYPNGKVFLAPALPFDWRDASVKTPDMSFSYRRTDDSITVDFKLMKPADVTAELFLYARELIGIDGAELVGLRPGFGRTKAVLSFGSCAEGRAVLHIRGEQEPILPQEIEAEPGSAISLTCTEKPARLIDPQNALAASAITESGISAGTANLSGHKWLCAVIGGPMPRYEVFHLNLSETAEEKERTARLHPDGEGWNAFRQVDLTSAFNCDIQKIYKQKYLSPRPLTVSARIGADSYSPWTFGYWRNTVPEIVLSKTGLQQTERGVPVPLQIGGGEKNVSFVSLWDNFPDSVTIPVNDVAKAAVLLLCGTTSPMQCGVENVRLVFRYESGAEEVLPLRNPVEFWSLCPLNAMPNSSDQVLATNSDYDYGMSAFCLPQIPPETLQLGENCRAVVIRWKLREGDLLQSVTLSAVSREVVVGLMALTLAK